MSRFWVPPAGVVHPAGVVSPAGVDWDYLLERRATTLKHSEDLPAYLLRPEVHALLASITSAQSRLLIWTLWVTGARISEALALTPRSFDFHPRNPSISLHTSKKRGRPRKAARPRPPRLIPLRDAGYLDLARMYCEAAKLPPDARLFPFTRQAADLRLRSVLKRYDASGQIPKRTIPVSPHTFRHSFAVNCILHGIPLPVLQGWLGHVSINSTVIYTQVLTAETGHLMAQIVF